jgi:adenylosuccinate lyase
MVRLQWSDINIFESYFAPLDIRSIFDERSVVESWLMFLGILAEVQGDLGIIPQEAAQEIQKKATLDYVDFNRIIDLYAKTKHSGLATVRALSEVCELGAGEYVHFGSSAPELWENTLAYRLKKAMVIFEEYLNDIRLSLNRLARIHRKTLMVERSLGRQALPTTFGFVAAVWSDAISKDLDRFKEAQKRILCGFLKGVIGTYASHYAIAGERCLEMERRVLEKLGLYMNQITFRRHLERLTEFLNLLVLGAQTFEKIFNDIYFQQRDEIAELEEPYGEEGPSGSSTLPQKKNPILCQGILARCKKIRSNAHAFAETHVNQSHDTISFSIENLIIPETCVLFGDMLHASKYVLANLKVNTEGMKKNLSLSNGLIMTESLMINLARRTGKKQMAHTIIHEASLKAVEEGKPFNEAILDNEMISRYFSKQEIQQILKPENYLGLIDMCIERVIRDA